MSQNKWFRAFLTHLPSVLNITADIVDDARNNDIDLSRQLDTSDLNSNEITDLEMVTITETEIFQIDQTSVQGIFTSEEWSYIVKRFE